MTLRYVEVSLTRSGLRPASRHQKGGQNPGFSSGRDLRADARTGPSDVTGIPVKYIGICNRQRFMLASETGPGCLSLRHAQFALLASGELG